MSAAEVKGAGPTARLWVGIPEWECRRGESIYLFEMRVRGAVGGNVGEMAGRISLHVNRELPPPPELAAPALTLALEVAMVSGCDVECEVSVSEEVIENLEELAEVFSTWGKGLYQPRILVSAGAASAPVANRGTTCLYRGDVHSWHALRHSAAGKEEWLVAELRGGESTEGVADPLPCETGMGAVPVATECLRVGVDFGGMAAVAGRSGFLEGLVAGAAAQVVSGGFGEVCFPSASPCDAFDELPFSPLTDPLYSTSHSVVRTFGDTVAFIDKVQALEGDEAAWDDIRARGLSGSGDRICDSSAPWLLLRTCLHLLGQSDPWGGFPGEGALKCVRCSDLSRAELAALGGLFRLAAEHGWGDSPLMVAWSDAARAARVPLDARLLSSLCTAPGPQGRSGMWNEVLRHAPDAAARKIHEIADKRPTEAFSLLWQHRRNQRPTR